MMLVDYILCLTTLSSEYADLDDRMTLRSRSRKLPSASRARGLHGVFGINTTLMSFGGADAAPTTSLFGQLIAVWKVTSISHNRWRQFGQPTNMVA